MIKLLPLFLICIVLGYLSEARSGYSYSKECYVYKDALFFSVMVICIIIFAGLRTSYNDTSSYISEYENAVVGNFFSGIQWNLGHYPGYNLIVNILKKIGFSSQFFIMFFSALTIGIDMWFIRKYTNNIMLSVFLYFTMGNFGFSMAAIKQCAAMALCVIAVDRQIQGKTGRCVFWVIIASLFHPFALMFLIIPFLDFRPFSTKSWILLGIFALLGINMQSWLGNMLDFISLMGSEYEEQSLVGEGVNLFRLGVVWAPVIVTMVTMRFWRKNSESKEKKYITNLSILNAEVMFIALFGNPIYFGRLANYFMLFQTISLTFLIQYFEKRSRVVAIGVIVVLYSMYCYYGNVMAGTSFDQSFSSTTIWYFLSHLRG